MPTGEPAQTALRTQRTAREAAPPPALDWSTLAHGGAAAEETEVLYDEPRRCRPAPDARTAGYFQHATHTAAFLADLVKAHSADFRASGRLTAWSTGPAAAPDGPQPYRVLGWTSSAVLRWTLSRRIDSLNPVAAFRLLDQPEIATLDRANRDYVVLAGAEAWALPPGSISARDLDLWRLAGRGELDGAFAVDFATYRERFAGTEIAA